MGAGDCETEDIDTFLRQKMESAMERLQDWFTLNPCASPEEGSDELFAILMGKRDQ